MTLLKRKKAVCSSVTVIVFIGLVIHIGVLSAWSLPLDSPVYLGTSRIEMTPRIGTPLAGYGRRKGKPSLGIHDPIYVKALSLAHKDTVFVFVAVDLVLVDRALRSEVIKKINNRISLSDEQLILFATHAHSGPGAIGRRFWQRFIMGKFEKRTFDKVTDTVSQAVIESLAQTYPVTIEYGETRIDEHVENRMDINLNEPSILKMLRFRRQDKSIAGNIVTLAAHPTILSSSNFHFSAGYPGVLTRLVDSHTTDSVTLFVNGAAADIRPRTKPASTEFEEMNTYAKSLYEKIKKISWEAIDLEPPWLSVFQGIKLPPVKVQTKWVKVPRILGSRLFPRKSVLQTVRMGRFVFSAIPAEVGSEIGVGIENQFRAKGLVPIIIGYANDYLGYVIPRRYYNDKTYYEARASFYGKKMDWFLQERIDEQIAIILTDDERQRLNPPGILTYNGDLPVLKLEGDPYHRGLTEGRLLSQEISHAYQEIFRYFRSQLPIPGLNRFIINRFLDRAWNSLEPYVSYTEYEHMRGLADGAGVPLRQVLRIHAIPEIHPTGCSNGAYWGPATNDKKLIAIRNLDWNRDIGVHAYAAIKHHKMLGQNNYVNIGYYGFNGVLSGVNESGISVGEIGATSSDESMRGVPMPFLLERVLSRASTLTEAATVFEQSDLTQGFNYVIASASEKKAFAVEATHQHIAIFYDQDPKELDVPYAMPIPNAVFRGDPALDPMIRDLQWASDGDPNNPGLEFPKGPAYTIRYLRHGELVQDHYGKIDVDIAKLIAQEIAPKTNIQSVVYAFPDFWVANAIGDLRATDCPYHYFNFNTLNSNVSVDSDVHARRNRPSGDGRLP